MKTIITFLLLLDCVASTYAQLRSSSRSAGTPTNIEYDFATGVVVMPKSIGQGQTIVLRVNNINTIGYRVTIQSTAASYQTEVPAELQAAFNLSKTQSKEVQSVTANSNVAVNAMAGLRATNPDGNALEASLATLIGVCNTYIRSVNRVQELSIKKEELVALSKKAHLTRQEVNRVMTPAYNIELNTLYDDFVTGYANAYVAYLGAYATAENLSTLPPPKP